MASQVQKRIDRIREEVPDGISTMDANWLCDSLQDGHKAAGPDPSGHISEVGRRCLQQHLDLEHDTQED